LLPTLLFLIGVYGLFALHMAWSRRQSGLLASRSRERKLYGRLTLAGSGVALGLLIFLYLWMPFDSPEEPQKLALVVAGQTEGWLADQGLSRQEYLPVKVQAATGQPVYTYLHPDTSYGQMLPEKQGAALRQLRKPLPKKPTKEARVKKPKANPRMVKKDKGPSKAAVKKKKSHTSPRGPAGSQQAHLRSDNWPTRDLHHHPLQEGGGGDW
jgi:hypothetical protein